MEEHLPKESGERAMDISQPQAPTPVPCVYDLAYPNSVEDKPIFEEAKQKLDKKYNLKIKVADLKLVEAIAEFEGIPKSVVLNQLIHRILVDELFSTSEADVRLAIACQADKKYPLRLDESWKFCVLWDGGLRDAANQMLENILCWNNATQPRVESTDTRAFPPGVEENHSKEFKTLTDSLGWSLKGDDDAE